MLRRVVGRHLACWLVSAASTVGLATPLSSAQDSQTSTSPSRDTSATIAATGTGIIRGRVVAAGTDEALRGAQITLAAAGLPDSVILTDANGRFEFSGLPAGSFSLRASKAGYVTGAFQQLGSGNATPLALSSGQTIERADITLTKAAAFTVTVTAESGEPVPDVQVEVLRRDPAGRLVRIGAGVSAFASTNDLGELRLFAIPPGEYFVRAGGGIGAPATPANQSPYTPTYYPGTSEEAQARSIPVAAGQELDVSIVLMKAGTGSSARAATITGVVRAANGDGVAAGISLTQYRNNGVRSLGYRSQADGTFTVPNVLAGEYVLSASSTTLTDSPVYASIPLTVAGVDLPNLELRLAPAAKIYGQVVFANGAPAGAKPGSIPLRAADPRAIATGTGGSLNWKDDWSFEFIGVTKEPLFRLRADVTTWSIKAVTLNGRDITDVPLPLGAGEVTGLTILLTDKPTTVTGKVTTRDGQVPKQFTAVIFVTDPDRWNPSSRHVAFARGNPQGQFNVVGLPPGEYVAAAVEAGLSVADATPETLGKLRARAVPLTLREGETTTIALSTVEF